jgi:hypothetical protein
MRRAMYHDGEKLFPAKMGAAELNRVRYGVGGRFVFTSGAS